MAPSIASSIVTLPLADWMSLKIYVVLLVFVRVGTAFMLMPGYGEPTVPVRMRLLAALGIGIAVAPVVAGMPAVVPPSIGIILGVSAEAVCVHAVVRAGITSFRLGGQLALPFLLLALVFNASLAAINRAMPAMPVFNLGAPAIVVAGLYLLAATVPGLIEQALAAYSDMLQTLR